MVRPDQKTLPKDTDPAYLADIFRRARDEYDRRLLEQIRAHTIAMCLDTVTDDKQITDQTKDWQTLSFIYLRYKDPDPIKAGIAKARKTEPMLTFQDNDASPIELPVAYCYKITHTPDFESTILGIRDYMWHFKMEYPIGVIEAYEERKPPEE